MDGAALNFVFYTLGQFSSPKPLLQSITGARLAENCMDAHKLQKLHIGFKD